MNSLKRKILNKKILIRKLQIMFKIKVWFCLTLIIEYRIFDDKKINKVIRFKENMLIYIIKICSENKNKDIFYH